MPNVAKKNPRTFGSIFRNNN